MKALGGGSVVYQNNGWKTPKGRNCKEKRHVGSLFITGNTYRLGMLWARHGQRVFFQYPVNGPARGKAAGK
jgi:hypothetical protein